MKLHILVLPSWFEYSRHATLGSFFKDQCRALARQGHKVGLIYPIPVSLKAPQVFFEQKPIYQDEQENFPILTQSYFTIPLMRRLNIQRRLHKYETLYQRYVARYGKPDILHAHSCALGPAGSAGIAAGHLSQKYNLPYVITEHGTAFHTGLYKDYDIAPIQNAFSRASALISVSESLKQDLIAFGVSRPIEVVGNVVDSEVFANASLLNRPQTQLYTFIAIAHIRPLKQLELLITAFFRLYQQYPHSRLVIVGKGSLKQQLEAQVHQHWPSDCPVTFTGELQREQVAEQLAKADCYVLTSIYETFAVVAHEALAAGKAVISTPCGGPEQTLQDLDEVVLADHDAALLYQAMQSKLERPDPQQKALKRRNYITTHFHPDAVGQRLSDIFKQVLASG